MRLLPLLLTIGLFTSCEKHSPATSRIPFGLQLDLPVISFSKDQLATAGTGYIEAVIEGKITEIHLPNGARTSTTSGQSFEEVLETISKGVVKQTETPPLLISATASTKFGVIRSVIRSAAMQGIYRIIFLVKSDTRGSGVIRFDLPTVEETTPMPKIDPFFLQIDDKDQIFSGSGASRERMDGGSEDRTLKKLEDQLELFSAAAKAAGCEIIPCLIYVHQEASYQRMITLLSMIQKYGLKPDFTDMEPEPRPKPIMPAPRKPTPPSF